MGNASGREEGAGSYGSYEDSSSFGGRVNSLTDHMPSDHAAADASESMESNSSPGSPSRSRSPHLFAPQHPVAPLRQGDAPPFFNPIWRSEAQPQHVEATDSPPEKGIPTLITWSHGGNSVSVEGTWDNWTSKLMLQRSGKDHALLLVLPPGIFHYRFIVDGESRHMPDLPFVSDEMGNICNVLDVHDYVPESLGSVSEFESPSSPDSSYSQSLPGEDDFAKEPVLVPQQLHMQVIGGGPKQEEKDGFGSSSSSSRPQHVVLNHLYIEKVWASQSVVGVGLTHRFESKYVSVVLYKPFKR